MLNTRNSESLAEIPANHSQVINIYAEVTSNMLVLSDQDDACMKLIINSFNIGDMRTSCPYMYIQGKQAVFHLVDLNSISVNLVGASNEIIDIDKEFTLTACAAESILKKLHAHDCVKKNIITFQARTINRGVSDIVFINLNPEVKEKMEVNFARGLISHAYAYLHENRLCLFFNPMTHEQENQIKNVLVSLFKEAQLESSVSEAYDAQTTKLIANQP